MNQTTNEDEPEDEEPKLITRSNGSFSPATSDGQQSPVRRERRHIESEEEIALRKAEKLRELASTQPTSTIINLNHSFYLTTLNLKTEKLLPQKVSKKRKATRPGYARDEDEAPPATTTTTTVSTPAPTSVPAAAPEGMFLFPPLLL